MSGGEIKAKRKIFPAPPLITSSRMSWGPARLVIRASAVAASSPLTSIFSTPLSASLLPQARVR